MWLLVHPENLIVWTLDGNEIFIAQTYCFPAQRQREEALSGRILCVSVAVMYL